MNHYSEYYHISWKQARIAVLVAVALIALVTMLVTGTDADVPQDISPFADDGRINVVHHFGGDVLYCVDENFAPTNELFTTDAGGIQLLNINGQLLWFVDAATVLEKIAEAVPGGGYVLVGEGQGTYGPVSLYVFKVNDIVTHFIFNGIDEHGKPNQIEFEGCTPVNPPEGGISLCTTAEINNAFLEQDQAAFLACYELVCPGIPVELGEACFCSQYPDTFVCGGGRG